MTTLLSAIRIDGDLPADLRAVAAESPNKPSSPFLVLGQQRAYNALAETGWNDPEE